VRDLEIGQFINSAIMGGYADGVEGARGLRDCVNSPYRRGTTAASIDLVAAVHSANQAHY
jgi:hypothetical protein